MDNEKKTDLIGIKDDWKAKSLYQKASYEAAYKESITNPEAFWAKAASRITWSKKWSKVKDTTFQSPVHIRWYEGAELNVCYNCVDRHLPKRKDQVALLFEPDDPAKPARKITYQQLSDEVQLMANILKKHGVKKGDCVTIYMPMIPEAVYAMLACARIGAMHSVIFGGFAPDAILDRLQDGKSRFIITADQGVRGNKHIPLKENVNEALAKYQVPTKVLLVRHDETSKWDTKYFRKGLDFWWHEERQTVATVCPPETMSSEDPLFILYTSGSTSKPKGVLHTSGGYLVYASLTHQVVFDYREGDVYWCTADVGWVTGHSYTVYGPLANGATSLLFEGVPHWPTVERYWQIIDKHQVNIFYTAPTALRALMREGEAHVKNHSRKSLRILGTVGEPINPEAWLWYYKTVGDERCPVIDTWWQTETGGILISPLPGVTDLKPGSATLPFFGVQPKILTPEGEEIHDEGKGVLVLADSWPGQMRTVYGDPKRFDDTYFSTYKGYYFTGDGCRRDADGYYWITGRVDDVLNVAGHRLGTAEIESSLVAHKSVAEAAAVAYPHDIKGQGIYVFVTLKKEIPPSDQLRKELIQWVAHEISPIARPDLLQWAPSLPKTRSGKIMRRILRKIAENTPDQVGDISTLADMSVVQDLIDQRLNR